MMSQNAYRLFTGLLRMAPEGQIQVRAYQQKQLQEKSLVAQPLQLSPGLASPSQTTTMATSTTMSPSHNINTSSNNHNNANNMTSPNTETKTEDDIQRFTAALAGILTMHQLRPVSKEVI